MAVENVHPQAARGASRVDVMFHNPPELSGGLHACSQVNWWAAWVMPGEAQQSLNKLMVLPPTLLSSAHGMGMWGGQPPSSQC